MLKAQGCTAASATYASTKAQGHLTQRSLCDNSLQPRQYCLHEALEVRFAKDKIMMEDTPFPTLFCLLSMRPLGVSYI